MGKVTENLKKLCEEVVKENPIEEPVRYKDKEVGQAKTYIIKGRAHIEYVITDEEVLKSLKNGTKRIFAFERGHIVYDIEK
jgi:hypothetical protein